MNRAEATPPPPGTFDPSVYMAKQCLYCSIVARACAFIIGDGSCLVMKIEVEVSVCGGVLCQGGVGLVFTVSTGS